MKIFLTAHGKNSRFYLVGSIRSYFREKDSIRRTPYAMNSSLPNDLLQLERRVIEDGRKGNSSMDNVDNEEIQRYSRQLIIFDNGLEDQLAIKRLSSESVSCGCWLLHPHDRAKSLTSKADSAAISLGRLNPNIQIKPITTALTSQNALEIISEYDIVLDASDNVATRYLLNDACVLSEKPLVSGSALRFEGQLTVYNYPPNVGTTYRCLFPDPPPPETVTNCSDGGVLGPVPGVIGTLQALEALKIILGKKESVYSGKMLLFDALNPLNSFRTVKLRPRKAAPIKELIDYEEFCGSKATDKDLALSLLSKETERITVSALSHLMKNEPSTSFIIIDVRSPSQQKIARLNASTPFPLSDMDRKDKIKELNKIIQSGGNELKDILFICRRGNDSQKAVIKYKSMAGSENIRIRDVIGGLHAWAKEIDSNFPIY
ncbi:MOCS3 [Lepeophtheirus salmonis]|uniref:Ubiquitin activating enzyme 4 n=1 Tax=Lepeophtheirus salmonis TaxID=72036 RepID=A0A7R8CWY1_LEPSM|nr:MOCS3 [Lepeophtheirus salmonis]CAF2956534.1 MOCS3 [Lepeophtheirus salmonis]